MVFGRFKGKIKPNKKYPLILGEDVIGQTRSHPYWLKNTYNAYLLGVK